jgi:hypothetical protein
MCSFKTDLPGLDYWQDPGKPEHWIDPIKDFKITFAILGNPH